MKHSLTRNNDEMAMAIAGATAFVLPVKPQPHQSIEVKSWGYSALTPKGCIEMRGYFDVEGERRYGSKFFPLIFTPGQEIYFREAIYEPGNYYTSSFDESGEYETRFFQKGPLGYVADGIPDIHHRVIGCGQMPREAARYFARITAVKVVRCQEVTDVDAIDMGFLKVGEPWLFKYFADYARSCTVWATAFKSGGYVSKPPLGPSPKQRFAAYYQSRYGTASYNNNDYLWLVAHEPAKLKA